MTKKKPPPGKRNMQPQTYRYGTHRAEPKRSPYHGYPKPSTPEVVFVSEPSLPVTRSSRGKRTSPRATPTGNHNKG